MNMRAGFFHPESQLGKAPVSCLVELQYKRQPQRIGEKPKSQPELRCTWMLNRVFFYYLDKLASEHTYKLSTWSQTLEFDGQDVP